MGPGGVYWSLVNRQTAGLVDTEPVVSSTASRLNHAVPISLESLQQQHQQKQQQQQQQQQQWQQHHHQQQQQQQQRRHQQLQHMSQNSSMQLPVADNAETEVVTATSDVPS